MSEEIKDANVNPGTEEATPQPDPVKIDPETENKPWYESVSEEYKGEASKYKTIDEYAKSKKAALDLVKKKIENLTEEEFEILDARFKRRANIPASLEEYSINTIAKSEAEISRVDENVLNHLKEVALKNGMTNEQLQAAYNTVNNMYIKEEQELKAYHDKNNNATLEILKERFGKELPTHRENIQKYIAVSADMFGVEDVFGVKNELVRNGAVNNATELNLDPAKYNALFFAMCERNMRLAEANATGFIRESNSPHASKRRIDDFMSENNHIMRNPSHPDYNKVRQAYGDLMHREYQNKH